jgi:phosphoglycerate kinase
MASLPSLEDLGDVSGKRVLVRTDFNVPMEGPDNARVIVDDFRIRAALPTIEWLTSRGAQVVCATHLGRPKGSAVEKYSVAPLRERLASLAPGVELMENLRFSSGEESNDSAFVAEITASPRLKYGRADETEQCHPPAGRAD